MKLVFDLIILEKGDKLKVNNKHHKITDVYKIYDKIVYVLDDFYHIPRELLKVEEINDQSRNTLF